MFHFIVGIPLEIVLKVHHQNTKWNSLYNFRHLFESDFIGTELGMAPMLKIWGNMFRAL